MPLLIIPLLIIGVLILFGLAFALVAMLVKMLFVPAVILIVILFWTRRDRQPQHHQTQRPHPYERASSWQRQATNRQARRELHNVQENDIKKKHVTHDNWDDF